MKRIIFNKDTIEKIRNYVADGHTMKETQNKFTLKYDTLARVMRENGIIPKNSKPIEEDTLSEEQKKNIMFLYENTKTTLIDLAEEVGIGKRRLMKFLSSHYSKEYMDNRKSAVYRNSKLGDKNPCFEKTGENHPNYKGMVDDGKGYKIILKPDWYTGRKGSKHVFYHSVVMCEALGITEIPKGFVVHHIDFDKTNNDISNLCLLTVSAHSRLHQLINKKK